MATLISLRDPAISVIVLAVSPFTLSYGALLTQLQARSLPTSVFGHFPLWNNPTCPGPDSATAASHRIPT